MALVTSGPRGRAMVAACCSRARRKAFAPTCRWPKRRRSCASCDRAAPTARRPPRAREIGRSLRAIQPCVALEEGDEPESLLLDISNLEHLWGQRDQAGRASRTFLHPPRLSRATSPSRTRSGWPGRWRTSEIADCGLRIADYLKQSAVRNPQSAIELPVESLRISADTAALLRELGIETIGQLLALPRDGLASRFGDELLRRLDQLTGAAREVIVPHRALAALGSRLLARRADGRPRGAHARAEPTGGAAGASSWPRAIRARCCCCACSAACGRPAPCRCGSACCSPRPARGS